MLGPVLGLLIAATVLSAPAHAASPEATEIAGRVRSGTGFFVSPDGFLLTSNHVVAGCPGLSVWRADGTERPSYLVAADPRHDVALLWADGLREGHVAAPAPLRPRVGQAVFTLGFGVIATQPLSPIVVEGSLAGSGTERDGNRVMMIRARLREGNSGGAVLADDGSLLGMVVGRDEENRDLGVAIPWGDIAPLLAAYGIALPARVPATSPKSMLATISMLIQCSPVPRRQRPR